MLTSRNFIVLYNMLARISAPICFFMIAAYSFYLYHHECEFLPPNPSRYVALTAESIWNDGRLEQDWLYRDFNERLARSRTQSKFVDQDEFARGARGELLPKHCALMALLAAPFYGLFGRVGLYLFNSLLVILILGAYCKIAARFSAEARLLALPFLLTGTQLLVHTYGFHYDLLGTVFVVGGAALVPVHPLWAGLLWGISPLVRITNGAVAIPLGVGAFLEWSSDPVDRRARVSDLLLGGIAGLGLFGFMNTIMWGGPLTTAYHRIPVFDRGRVIENYDWFRHSFSVTELTRDWGEKLFGDANGILFWNPLLLVTVPMALWFCFYGRRLYGHSYTRIASALGAALVNLLLTFSYDNWRYSVLGNRFAFPAIIFISLLLVPLIELVEKLGLRRAKFLPQRTFDRRGY